MTRATMAARISCRPDWPRGKTPAAASLPSMSASPPLSFSRVCSPASTHFLDLFFDRRRDRAVADVGVSLYQEIAADDHPLGFGVIDVGPNTIDILASGRIQT